ncbi:MAG: NusG domain II-containing protein [Oscillospiraceae bacterium]|jgi:hypothetical protein|nr:NusG domain II-containing protein [Oscillospiraceae bacterium]
MNKRTALLAALLGTVVLLCAGVIWWQHSSTGNGVLARVYQRGELVEEIRLDQVQQPYSFLITGEKGAENVVEVAPGQIRIVSASCPDQVCVRQGWISDSTVPVVCLPNQVIVEIVGGESFADTAAG